LTRHLHPRYSLSVGPERAEIRIPEKEGRMSSIGFKLVRLNRHPAARPSGVSFTLLD
jgi:hypothetical protein